MSYECLECGNTSTKKFPAGKCPACFSFKIKSSHKENKKDVVVEKEAKTKLELALLVLLWGFFVYGTWDKYISQWFS